MDIRRWTKRPLGDQNSSDEPVRKVPRIQALSFKPSELHPGLYQDAKYQALLHNFKPEATFTFPQTKFGKENRSFQRAWLDEYEGLIYDKSNDGAYCLYCCLFRTDVSEKGVLIQEPFRRWKAARPLFNNHFHGVQKDKSKGARGHQIHQFCVIKAAEFKKVQENKQFNVVVQHKRKEQEQIDKNRAAMSSIVKTILMCGRQGLPLRGHRDDSRYYNRPEHNPGNFQVFLEARVDAGDSDLQQHFSAARRNATYRSKTTQNEVIVIVGDMILHEIIRSCKEDSRYFAVSADEVQDVSNIEQMAIVVRHWSKSSEGYTIREDFVGYVDVSYDTSGATLVDVITTQVEELGLSLADLRGQCYDGAGNMCGHISGVGPRIECLYPKAVHFWCASHQLNRAIVQPCTLPLVRNMMGMTDKVVRFFNFSSKKGECLQTIIDSLEEAPTRTKLQELCRTRWVERHTAYEIFIELYPHVVTALEEISGSTLFNRESASDATSLLVGITKFEFIMTVVVVQDLLGFLQGLTSSLQAQTRDIIEGFTMVDTVKKTLEELRKDIGNYHHTLYESAVSHAAKVNVEPAIPRICGRQTQRANIQADTAEDYYRVNLTVPFLDHLLLEMTNRFSKLKEKALASMRLLPGYILPDRPLGAEELEYYVEDLPRPDVLPQELRLWHVFWANRSGPKPKTVLETMASFSHCNFPNVTAILKILGVFPVTSAECERSFSALRRLKDYTRANINEERLNGLAMMYVHRDILINPMDVVDKFARRNRRRMIMENILDDDDRSVQ